MTRTLANHTNRQKTTPWGESDRRYFERFYLRTWKCKLARPLRKRPGKKTCRRGTEHSQTTGMQNLTKTPKNNKNLDKRQHGGENQIEDILKTIPHDSFCFKHHMEILLWSGGVTKLRYCIRHPVTTHKPRTCAPRLRGRTKDKHMLPVSVQGASSAGIGTSAMKS